MARVVGDIASRSAWTRQPADSSAVSDQAQKFSSAKERADRPLATSTRLVPRTSEKEHDQRPWEASFKADLRDRSVAFDSGRAPVLRSGERLQEHRQPAVAQLLDRGSDRKFADLRFIGQAKGLLLLFEDKDDLVVIDQHAVHERIMYERLRAELNKGRIASQRLLVPHSVDMGPTEAERIEHLQKEIERLGLDVSQSGPDRVAIHAVPARLSDAAPERLLADVVLALEQGRQGSGGDTDEKTLAAMACHGSIRGGRAVERAEAESLVEQMDAIDFAGHCPHGRPVLKRIPWREILRGVDRA